ncbi:MAG TPA: HAMP domain-containing sensor histidine kinase [Candidatus Dormibacteraeota bacterium]|nr:HAMP domain-containing sensor histidine kinase [Candidatus Dormibacteraeota bacterium]
MTGVLQVLQYAASLVFVLLGLLTLRDFLRHRERSRGFLALAIGLLGVVSLGGLVQRFTGSLGAPFQDLLVVVLLASGYALLLFRSSFIPVAPRTQWITLGGLILVAGVYIVLYGGGGGGSPSSLQAGATALVVGAWSACVAEPIVRFWIASSDKPAVQRGRLRSLSVGFGSLVVILIFAALGSGAPRPPVAQLFTQLVALLAAPLLYLAFSPPRWLRREWAYPEEQEYRDAVRELLLFSPTRQRVAERALEWAIRFVGADAGFIADADGSVLAASGIDESQAERLQGQLGAPSDDPTHRIHDGQQQTAVVIPLPLSTGTGVLAVIAGAFTPFFGSDEVGRLTGYAANITAGLDRAVLTERIAALERTKTEFLNLASHELRGPITVIRGYLSMLDRGSLGEIPEQARKALPVLTAKADEMNGLVEQMIEAARLEDGRLELSTRRADLREVVRLAIEMAQPLTDSTHALVFDSPDIEVPVMIDVERISTVVGNLLSNAIKYSPAGGSVTCSVALEDHVGKVVVTDQGVGIPADRIDCLFTRFGRIVTPETSHIPGTGLGLYLSRELARLHGGDLTATSIQGQGSTFTLAVPLMEEARA